MEIEQCLVVVIALTATAIIILIVPISKIINTIIYEFTIATALNTSIAIVAERPACVEVRIQAVFLFGAVNQDDSMERGPLNFQLEPTASD